MTTPTNGATLTSNSETFTWNANGNAVTEWWFRLGSTVGGKISMNQAISAPQTVCWLIHYPPTVQPSMATVLS